MSKGDCLNDRKCGVKYNYVMSSHTEALKKTILELVRDLRENVFFDPLERGELDMIEIFFKNMHPDMIMEHVEENVMKYKQQIKDRKAAFFLSNSGSIFAGLPNDRVKYYSEIIGNGTGMDQEDRDTVWAYFDAIIDIVKNYRKTK